MNIYQNGANIANQTINEYNNYNYDKEVLRELIDLKRVVAEFEGGDRELMNNSIKNCDIAIESVKEGKIDWFRIKKFGEAIGNVAGLATNGEKIVSIAIKAIETGAHVMKNFPGF